VVAGGERLEEHTSYRPAHRRLPCRVICG
jgi:hypothetical protein